MNIHLKVTSACQICKGAGVAFLKTRHAEDFGWEGREWGGGDGVRKKEKKEKSKG